MQRTIILAIAFVSAAAIAYFGYFRQSSGPQDSNPQHYEFSDPGDKSLDEIGTEIGRVSNKPTVGGESVPETPFVLSDLLPKAQPISYETTELMIDAASKGDNIAAMLVYEIAERCANRKLLLHQIESSAGELDSKTTSEMLAQYDDHVLICQTISDDVITNRIDYVRMAANRGDIRAQVSFITAAPSAEDALKSPEAVIAFKEEARQFLHSAAAAGSVDAMVELSHQYRSGMFSSDPNSQVMALALMRVADESGLSHGTGQVYGLWTETMTSAEIEQAERLAQQMLDRCCS